MSKQKKQSLTAASLIVLLILIDQVIKVAVKLNMNLGESIHIFDWFQIEFVENVGMAWGMELGSKLFLSVFRIIAIGLLLWYISNRIRQGARTGYIVVLAMITAGAAGNIFDSIFYGQIFTASTPYYIEGATPATLVSWGEGYAPVLMGKVVDMFYFPLFRGTFPDWFPLWGRVIRLLLTCLQLCRLLYFHRGNNHYPCIPQGLQRLGASQQQIGRRQQGCCRKDWC